VIRLGVAVPSSNTSVYRFGVFEFDPRTAELRKNGVKLKLQDQPSQVLVHLLARAGDLLSREELQSKVWPKDTFVDFETGLNTVVKRLRETLGDSAESPTFIETIPRKGYRFIAPVEVCQRNGYQRSGVAEPGKHRYLILLACILAGTLAYVGFTVWRNQPRTPKVVDVVQVTNDGTPKAPNSFVTDGVHLYFKQGTWYSGLGIAQVSASGGETTRIETPLKEVLAIYAISPDFSELLVSNGWAVNADPATGRSLGASELWVQPLPAGTPHRVGNIYASAACYTPDGRGILYADGHSLVRIDRDGNNAHELSSVQGVVRGLRYSPDGKRIRFYIDHTSGWHDGGKILWELDANGRNLHVLLPSQTELPFQCCGNWSPNGQQYFYQAGRGTDQAIWVMPEQRFIFGGRPGSPSRLISGPLRLSAPVSSTDGKKLFVTGEQLRVEPVRYHSKTHRFESYLNGISTSSFEFSRDRKWVAYVSYPDMSLWRSRVDGTDKMQLTFPPSRAYGPRWSPDGSQIAFMDVRFGHAWAVSVISSSGGPLQSFPHGSDPNWLPEGRSIICSRSSPDDKAPLAGIFRVELESGKSSFIPNSQGRFSPRVSPDGRYIAAFSQTATEVLLFDSKTNQWSSLAKSGLFSYNLWSPDGQYVYMRDSHAGSPGIVRVRIPNGRMEEVVSLKGFPQPPDILAGWFGLTPDGDPVVIRDRSVQEIYALELQYQ
jgi:DNA-binding winged helix-turn-helix (wHTH) protein/Tol biopolymer transport system component